MLFGSCTFTLVSITILKPHFCHPYFRHWTIQLINSPCQCIYSFYSDPCEHTRIRLEYFRRSLIDLLLLSTLGVLPASISSFCDCLPISHCLILQEMPWVSPPSYWFRCLCTQECHNKWSLRFNAMNSDLRRCFLFLFDKMVLAELVGWTRNVVNFLWSFPSVPQ